MEQRTFKNSGLKVGRIRKIEIWIHWSLLLLLAYFLHGFWMNKEFIPLKALGIWGLSIGSIFLTVFLHELGHCYAAFRMGGGADAIVLWPLGGLAYCDAPRIPRSQFWVAAGGPLVNVAIIALLLIAIPAISPAGWEGLMTIYSDDASPVIFLKALLRWNSLILFFNLLPIWPLDGGRIFQAVLWGRLKSIGRASQVTVWASRITIFAVVIISIFARDLFGWWVLLILIWAFYETELLRHRAREEEEDYIFGYDFSRGYTSLERTLVATGKRARRTSWTQRLRNRRQRKRAERHAAMREQVDVLLEKISREGMASLTARERRFLDSASRRLKGG